ncbi:uncharacterized protein LOC144437552 [Glandiceps talaboti]
MSRTYRLSNDEQLWVMVQVKEGRMTVDEAVDYVEQQHERDGMEVEGDDACDGGGDSLSASQHLRSTKKGILQKLGRLSIKNSPTGTFSRKDKPKAPVFNEDDSGGKTEHEVAEDLIKLMLSQGVITEDDIKRQKVVSDAYKSGDAERLLIANLVKNGRMSIDDAMRFANNLGIASSAQRENECIAEVNNAIEEKKLYNFGVYKYYKHKQSQRRILQIDFQGGVLCNIQKGNLNRKFRFSQVERYESDEGTKFCIYFADYHEYELEADNLEEKEKILRLLQIIVEQNKSEIRGTKLTRRDRIQSLPRCQVVIKEGELEKKSNKYTSTWVRRWVRIRQGELSYYKLGEDRQTALNIIQLSDEETHISKADYNALTITTRSKVYYFRIIGSHAPTETSKHRDEWWQALKLGSGERVTSYSDQGGDNDDVFFPRDILSAESLLSQHEGLSSTVNNLQQELEKLNSVLAIVNVHGEAHHSIEKLQDIAKTLETQLRRPLPARPVTNHTSISSSVLDNRYDAIDDRTVGFNDTESQISSEQSERYVELPDHPVSVVGEQNEDSSTEVKLPDQTLPVIEEQSDASSTSVMLPSNHLDKDQEDGNEDNQTLTVNSGEDQVPCPFVDLVSPRNVKPMYMNVIQRDESSKGKVVTSGEDSGEGKMTSSFTSTEELNQEEKQVISPTREADELDDSVSTGNEPEGITPSDQLSEPSLSSRPAAPPPPPPPPLPPPPPQSQDYMSPPLNATEGAPPAPPIRGISSSPEGPPPPIPPPPVPPLSLNSGIPPPPPPPLLSPPATPGTPITLAFAPVQTDGPLPKKNCKKSKVKMRPFHWNKVPNHMVNKSVWKTTKDVTDKLDTPLLEDMFSSSTDKEVVSTQDHTKKKAVSLLDAKLAQNIGIFLSGFKIDPQELRGRLTYIREEEGGLSLEHINILRRYQPSSEDIDMFKQYKGNPSELADTDQFMMQLCEIPFLRQRLELLLHINEFPIEFEDLEPTICTVLNACMELYASDQFVSVLEYILAIGNYMNSQSNKGYAHGFKLGTLVKLVDCRGKDKKYTLLKFLVEQINNGEPQLLGFFNEMTNVEKSADVSTKGLTAEVDVMKKDLTKIKKSAIQISKNKKATNQDSRFCKQVEDFVNEYENKLKKLHTTCEDMNRMYNKVLIKYGETGNIGSEEFFSWITEFIKSFKKEAKNLNIKIQGSPVHNLANIMKSSLHGDLKNNESKSSSLTSQSSTTSNGARGSPKKNKTKEDSPSTTRSKEGSPSKTKAPLDRGHTVHDLRQTVADPLAADKDDTDTVPIRRQRPQSFSSPPPVVHHSVVPKERLSPSLTGRPTHEGYLDKLSSGKHFSPKWDKRYFELSQTGHLHYFKKRNDKNLGSIYLKGCPAGLDEDRRIIVLETEDRTYKLRADDAEDAIVWLEKIFCHTLKQ